MREITIEIAGGNNFTVREGDRYVDRLGWDEMIGQVAHLTHPSIGGDRYTMLTAEQHAERDKRWKEMAAAGAQTVLDANESAGQPE